MRVADRPLPPVTLDAGAFATWPVRPVLAVTGLVGETVYDAAAVYDAPLTVYDGATAGVLVDASCDLYGLELEVGNPDDAGLFDAGHLVAQLDNASGVWSRYNVDGTPAAGHGPGAPISLWAHAAAGDWWLFSGIVSRWDDRADATVEIEAFDVFSDLAQPVGAYTPGAAGDRPGVRCAAVLAAAGRADVPHRFDAGTVTLTAQPTELAPLEELQTVIGSDGGRLYVDADGTVVSTDRLWRAGRADQTTVPVLTDNVCQTVPAVVWDPVLSTTDVGLADRVTLANVAKLVAVAGNPSGRYVVAATGQQWTVQTEGDALAAYLFDQQRAARLHLEEFDLYLFDPRQPNLWGAVDWRLFDRLRFVHDAPAVGGTARLDLFVLVTTLIHAITADGWVVTVGTSTVTGFTAPVVWDAAGAVWDDVAPLSVWGF